MKTMAFKKKTAKHKTLDEKTQNFKARVKWFALMGYNKDNEDETGMLGLDFNAKKLYKIVHDVQEALKFPSMNIDNVKGFGTPEQWLDFFNHEPDLERWKFHLIKIMKH